MVLRLSLFAKARLEKLLADFGVIVGRVLAIVEEQDAVGGAGVKAGRAEMPRTNVHQVRHHLVLGHLAQSEGGALSEVDRHMSRGSQTLASAVGAHDE